MKSENLTEVIETMKLITNNDREKLNMQAGTVWHRGTVIKPRHECGTVHCFAGWYFVAYLQRNGISIDEFEDTSGYLDYSEGVNLMSRTLELPEPHLESDLSDWARANPDLWGNHKGGLVFGHKMAFYSSKDRLYGAENINDIIDHLTEVRNRLINLEEFDKVFGRPTYKKEERNDL